MRQIIHTAFHLDHVAPALAHVSLRARTLGLFLLIAMTAFGQRSNGVLRGTVLPQSWPGSANG